MGHLNIYRQQIMSTPGNSVQQMAMAIERELGNTGKEAIARARGLEAKQKTIKPIPQIYRRCKYYDGQSTVLYRYL